MIKKLFLLSIFLVLCACTKVPSPACTETLRLPARAQNAVEQPINIIQYCDDSIQDGDTTHSHGGQS